MATETEPLDTGPPVLLHHPVTSLQGVPFVPSLQEMVNHLGGRIEAEVDPMSKEIHTAVQWVAQAAHEEVTHLQGQISAILTHFGLPQNLAQLVGPGLPDVTAAAGSPAAAPVSPLVEDLQFIKERMQDMERGLTAWFSHPAVRALTLPDGGKPVTQDPPAGIAPAPPPALPQASAPNPTDANTVITTG
ncbi:MAG TPA: hypothetical protein VGM15_03235 [Burkholderiaceae bacterium]|jgi:hypothetical protein